MCSEHTIFMMMPDVVSRECGENENDMVPGRRSMDQASDLRKPTPKTFTSFSMGQQIFTRLFPQPRAA